MRILSGHGKAKRSWVIFDMTKLFITVTFHIIDLHFQVLVMFFMDCSFLLMLSLVMLFKSLTSKTIPKASNSDVHSSPYCPSYIDLLALQAVFLSDFISILRKFNLSISQSQFLHITTFSYHSHHYHITMKVVDPLDFNFPFQLFQNVILFDKL